MLLRYYWCVDGCSSTLLLLLLLWLWYYWCGSGCSFLLPLLL
jgi:hypothetical protein